MEEGIVLEICNNYKKPMSPTPELLKRTDTRTHVRAKFSRLCAKFKLLNAELAKQALFHIFGTI